MISGRSPWFLITEHWSLTTTYAKLLAMKIIAIRTFAGLLIIMGLNMFAGGTIPTMERQLAIQSYQTGKQAVFHVATEYTQNKLQDPTQKEEFEKNLKKFEDRISGYSDIYLTQTRMTPYIFSALALIIGALYIGAGIGTLRLKYWSKKIGIGAACLWPVFYAYLMFITIGHINFLESVAIDLNNLLGYINVESYRSPELAIRENAVPTLIISSFFIFLLFTAAPIAFFLSPAVEEELS